MYSQLPKMYSSKMQCTHSSQKYIVPKCNVLRAPKNIKFRNAMYSQLPKMYSSKMECTHSSQKYIVAKCNELTAPKNI